MTKSIIKIAVPAFKLDKKGEINFPIKKWEVPENVNDVAYFNFAVQFHAYEMGLKQIDSKLLTIEFEKVDYDSEKAVKAHNESVTMLTNIMDTFKKEFTNWKVKNAIPNELITEFEADVFVRTYTAIMLGFYSYREAYSTEKGETKTRTILNAKCFPSLVNGKTLKHYGLELETLLSQDNVKKADKLKAYKPFIDLLMDNLFPSDLDNIRYGKSNFGKISQRYFHVWLSSMRTDVKKKFETKDPTVLSQNLAYIGMAWLGVVNIADVEKEVEKGYTINDIQKRQTEPETSEK